MKICFLDKTSFKYNINDINSYKLRGAETVLINLAKSLNKFGHSVSVINNCPKNEKIKGIDWININSISDKPTFDVAISNNDCQLFDYINSNRNILLSHSIQNLEKFIRKNSDFLSTVIERAKSRHKYQELKDAAKKGKKQKRQRIEKLLDANERKNREDCTLFICEGDSAIGGLRSARDKLRQGGIALKGKPMNVSQATIKDILK